MNLFQLGDFTLRSGAKSRWKIECDALTPDDWAALAAMAVEVLPPFRIASGVPRGGQPFAAALNVYATHREADPVLVAEDVVTTGGSMERYRQELPYLLGFQPCDYLGVCVFARGPCPGWVTPLFQMTNPVSEVTT